MKYFRIMVAVLTVICALAVNVWPVRVPDQGEIYLEQSSQHDSGEFRQGFPFAFLECTVVHNMKGKGTPILRETTYAPVQYLKLAANVFLCLGITAACLWSPMVQINRSWVTLLILAVFGAVLSAVLLPKFVDDPTRNLISIRLFLPGREFFLFVYAVYIIGFCFLIDRMAYIAVRHVWHRMNNYPDNNALDRSGSAL